jgi:hypothetical protein
MLSTEAAPDLESAVSATDEDARDYELLRRAICERDDDAWSAVVERYTRLVRSWVRHSGVDHPSEEAARINFTFERFWRAITPDRFAGFTNLAALLQYLKLCAGTVTLDEARAAKRRPASSLDALLAANPDLPCPRAADDPASEVFSAIGADEVWSAIEKELPHPADRLLVYLSFVSGLAPAAVCARYPHVFPSVAELYRRKANILERLRRSPAMRALVE